MCMVGRPRRQLDPLTATQAAFISHFQPSRPSWGLRPWVVNWNSPAGRQPVPRAAAPWALLVWKLAQRQHFFLHLTRYHSVGDWVPAGLSDRQAGPLLCPHQNRHANSHAQGSMPTPLSYVRSMFVLANGLTD